LNGSEPAGAFLLRHFTVGGLEFQNWMGVAVVICMVAIVASRWIK
jgi:hypothetical protein